MFNRTQAQSVGSNKFDYNYKVRPDRWTSGTESNYLFKRAPGFFDVVTYEGNSTQQTSISHNLGVVPEVIIAKVRNGTGNWNMYHKEIGNGLIRLNLNNAAITGYDYWQSSGNVHTATTFDLATLAGANANTLM